MKAALSLFFLLTPLLNAAEDAKLLPPGITKEKAAEGWIALFDGETTYGLKITGPVKVDQGVLVVGGDAAARVETTARFNHFDLTFEYRLDGKSAKFKLKTSAG